MFEGVDTIVLYEELAYHDVLPVHWRLLHGAVDESVIAGYEERNLRVLQACVALEEYGPVEKPDENSPHAADILRIDLKINLLLDLVGQILTANHPRPPAVPVRFNAQGAVWRAAPPLPEAGLQGMLEIHLRECIAEPLRLIGRVASVSPDGHVKVRFAPPGEAVADLIEKLAFRRHRRRIAGTRQPRRAG